MKKPATTRSRSHKKKSKSSPQRVLGAKWAAFAAAARDLKKFRIATLYTTLGVMLAYAGEALLNGVLDRLLTGAVEVLADVANSQLYGAMIALQNMATNGSLLRALYFVQIACAGVGLLVVRRYRTLFVLYLLSVGSYYLIPAFTAELRPLVSIGGAALRNLQFFAMSSCLHFLAWQARDRDSSPTAPCAALLLGGFVLTVDHSYTDVSRFALSAYGFFSAVLLTQTFKLSSLERGLMYLYAVALGARPTMITIIDPLIVLTYYGIMILKWPAILAIAAGRRNTIRFDPPGPLLAERRQNSSDDSARMRVE